MSWNRNGECLEVLEQEWRMLRHPGTGMENAYMSWNRNGECLHVLEQEWRMLRRPGTGMKNA
jgi:hypothetical protein